MQFMRHGKYGNARQATNDNPMWHRKDPICMANNRSKNTDTHNI